MNPVIEPITLKIIAYIAALIGAIHTNINIVTINTLGPRGVLYRISISDIPNIKPNIIPTIHPNIAHREAISLFESIIK